jgi:hypothetical protein
MVRDKQRKGQVMDFWWSMLESLGISSLIPRTIVVYAYIGLIFWLLLLLPVGCPLDSLVLYHFNPISIGIQNKRNVVHPPIGQTLLEVHLEGLETVACSLEIIHRDT